MGGFKENASRSEIRDSHAYARVPPWAKLVDSTRPGHSRWFAELTNIIKFYLLAFSI